VSQKLPDTTIDAIREAKVTGTSLREISEIFGCSKSTASLYCRNLFDYRDRLYKTEEEARFSIAERNKADKDRHKRYKYSKKYRRCINCGQPIYGKKMVH